MIAEKKSSIKLLKEEAQKLDDLHQQKLKVGNYFSKVKTNEEIFEWAGLNSTLTSILYHAEFSLIVQSHIMINQMGLF